MLKHFIRGFNICLVFGAIVLGFFLPFFLVWSLSIYFFPLNREFDISGIIFGTFAGIFGTSAVTAFLVKSWYQKKSKGKF